MVEVINNLLQATMRIFHDIVVPEPEDSKSPFAKIGSSPLIVMMRFAMLASIQLNAKLLLQTAVINDERANRELSPEFMTCQSAVSEQSPKSLLDAGL